MKKACSQAAKAPVFDTGIRWFESNLACHSSCGLARLVERALDKGEVVGSSPAAATISSRGVAQLVARLVWDQDVGGSSPLTPTIYCRK